MILNYVMEARAARFQDYVAAVGEGEIVTRSMMAERMGASYSTALYNLDRAVTEGALARFVVTGAAQQTAWGYAHPGVQLQLEW